MSGIGDKKSIQDLGNKRESFMAKTPAYLKSLMDQEGINEFLSSSQDIFQEFSRFSQNKNGIFENERGFLVSFLDPKNFFLKFG